MRNNKFQTLLSPFDIKHFHLHNSPYTTHLVSIHLYKTYSIYNVFRQKNYEIFMILQKILLLQLFIDHRKGDNKTLVISTIKDNKIRNTQRKATKIDRQCYALSKRVSASNSEKVANEIKKSCLLPSNVKLN